MKKTLIHNKEYTAQAASSTEGKKQSTVFGVIDALNTTITTAASSPNV